MKFYIKILSISMLFSILSLFFSVDAVDKHVIGCRPAGFFSNFFGVLNHLDWCETHNRCPVVYWENTSFYFVPQGYNASLNVWEYYFDPVSSCTYQNGDRINELYDPKNHKVHFPSFASYRNCLLFRRSLGHRHHAHFLINKYIKVKQEVLDKIDLFFKNNIQDEQIIGIHLRGTDKNREVKQISPTVIFENANQIASQLNLENPLFFIATDDNALLDLSKKNLKGRVIYCDHERSLNGKPIHTRAFSKAELGEQALIDVIILSKCTAFIHTCSNFSMAVYCFNPEINGILLG